MARRTALKPRIRRRTEAKRFVCPECEKAVSVHKMSKAVNRFGVYVCSDCEEKPA